MIVWRICRRRHAPTAFSGEGARRASGRWNSAGVPIAYSSSSLSLAACELFVHIDPEDEPDDLMAIAARLPIPEAEMEAAKAWTMKLLADDWRFSGHAFTRALGDAWAKTNEFLTMPVPSIVIDGEWNILINPMHLEFASLVVVESKPFRFDPRMFHRG